MKKPTRTTKIASFLTQINSSDLNWHAERYVSAKLLQDLIDDLVLHELSEGPEVTDVAERMDTICEACEGDGANWAYIPCLGGKPQEMWCKAVGELHWGA